ncbi:hypothetical protein [Kitasatospora phosalacinea]|uniref:hypothetical protein n=1 Tax=Kitasatospora phosalacinea TaxID=2065 RepID=UPI0012FF463A|nr:hypothetical protein [Kitasatospora phosalacinea]
MTDFPVLGIPGWGGSRGMTVTGGTGAGTDSVIHGYLTGGPRSAPLLVFAQSTVRDQSAAALRNLLGHHGRPEHAELLGPPRLEETIVTVTGTPRPGVRHRWADGRVGLLTFDWERAHVCVASWEHPLDAAFLASLGPLGPPRPGR